MMKINRRRMRLERHRRNEKTIGLFVRQQRQEEKSNKIIQDTKGQHCTADGRDSKIKRAECNYRF